MKKIRFENIRFDTTGEEMDGEPVDLPETLEGEFDEDFDPELEGADFISKRTGWCVERFTFQVLN